MPDDITTNADGSKSFVSLRESAWHQFGTVVQNEMTDEQLLQLAHLAYEVVKTDLYTKEVRIGGNQVAHDQYERVDGWKQLRRADTGASFGCVGENFRAFQNTEMIQLMRRIAAGNDMVWETAGALGANGQQVWCLARLPALQLALGNDLINSYMLITNGHGNARALNIMPTLIRVVCANTMRAATVATRAQREVNAAKMDLSHTALSVGYSINHTTGLDKAVEQVAKAYTHCAANAAATQELYEQLAKIKLTADDAQDYWQTVFAHAPAPDETERSRKLRDKRTDARREALAEIWDSGTNKGLDTENSLFSAFQAVVEYVDHVAPAHTPATRFTRSMFGEGTGAKQHAWTVAVASTEG